MDLKVQFKGRDKLVRDIMSVVGPDGRRDLFSVAAKSVFVVVQRHVRRTGQTRHRWATMLGGRPTGHLTKGARAITWHAAATYGIVEVPIPGITRARHDLVIRPKLAQYLTIPANAISYGRRASELSALGWRLFRGKGKGERILFGHREKETRILYWLKDEVTVPKDPSLLPADKQINDASNLAIAMEIMRVARKVCRMV